MDEEQRDDASGRRARLTVTYDVDVDEDELRRHLLASGTLDPASPDTLRHLVDAESMLRHLADSDEAAPDAVPGVRVLDRSAAVRVGPPGSGGGWGSAVTRIARALTTWD